MKLLILFKARSRSDFAESAQIETTIHLALPYEPLYLRQPEINIERNTAMSQIMIALSMWLHALATALFIGHYLLLSLIYLPVLEKNGGRFLSEISKRSRRWLYASLLIFILTGTYLMLIDPGYLGFMNFGNLWGILMVVKHILIIIILALGFWYNALLRIGPMMSSSNSAELAIRRFRMYSNLMAILGVLILLLTALAQVE